jgi:hypothetical protein
VTLLGFPTNSIRISHLPHACYISHGIVHNSVAQLVFGEEYRLWALYYKIRFHPPVTCFLLDTQYSVLMQVLVMCT